MIGYKSNVVLPDRLLEQANNLSEDDFRQRVLKYLKKYPDYELIDIEQDKGFAVCRRKGDWNG